MVEEVRGVCGAVEESARGCFGAWRFLGWFFLWGGWGRGDLGVSILAMAPTTAGCCPILQTLTHEPMETGGSGRRRLSLDSWVCLPLLRPVRTVSHHQAMSQQSSAASCCPKQDGMSAASTMSLDISFTGGAGAGESDEGGFARESGGGCETPKAKEHRIPDVDVGFCPPAPRKPRAMARRRRVQPTSFFHAPDFEIFLSQAKLQVSS